jgi:hypothetical protein
VEKNPPRIVSRGSWHIFVEQWGTSGDLRIRRTQFFTEAMMKKFLLTAAALTLGTSALAWTPKIDTLDASSAAVAKPGDMMVPWANQYGSGLKSAAIGTFEGAKAGAVADSLASVNRYHVDTSAKLAGLDQDMKVPDQMAWAAPAADTAGYAMAKDPSVGMGGPVEDVWPACNPGPGDDRCIQLYEPGVGESLAALKSSAEIGMGGPFEPAPADAKPADTMDHAAMGHDSGASAKVETPLTEAEAAAAIAAKGAATPEPQGTDPGKGIGGPVESRSGYPACSATVTDSCIQLYERGVTGQGN